MYSVNRIKLSHDYLSLFVVNDYFIYNIKALPMYIIV